MRWMLITVLLFAVATAALAQTPAQEALKEEINLLVEQGSYERACSLIEGSVWGEVYLPLKWRLARLQQIQNEIPARREELQTVLGEYQEMPPIDTALENLAVSGLEDLGRLDREIRNSIIDLEEAEKLFDLDRDGPDLGPHRRKLEDGIETGNREMAKEGAAGIEVAFSSPAQMIIAGFGPSESGIPYVAKKAAMFTRLLHQAQEKFGDTEGFSSAIAVIEAEVKEGKAIPLIVQSQPEYAEMLKSGYYMELARLESPPEPETSTTKTLVAPAEDTEDTSPPTEPEPDPEGEPIVVAGDGHQFIDFTGEYARDLDQPAEERTSYKIEPSKKVLESSPPDELDHKRKIVVEDTSETEVGEEIADAGAEKASEATPEDSGSEVASLEEGAGVDEVPKQVPEEEQEIASTTSPDTDTEEVADIDAGEIPRSGKELVSEPQLLSLDEIISHGLAKPGDYIRVDELLAQFDLTSDRKKREEATASLGQIYLGWRLEGRGQEFYEYLEPRRNQNKYLRGVVSWIEKYYAGDQRI